MAFLVARVTVEYNYGWECETCKQRFEAEGARRGSSPIQYYDSGYSRPEDAGGAAKDHNRRYRLVHARWLAKRKGKKRATRAADSSIG